MAGEIGWINNGVNDKRDFNTALSSGAYISDGSSREFEKKHGTDWFANAVSSPSC